MIGCGSISGPSARSSRRVDDRLRLDIGPFGSQQLGADSPDTRRLRTPPDRIEESSSEIRPRCAIRVEEQDPWFGGGRDAAIGGSGKAGVVFLVDDCRGQIAGSFFRDLGRSVGGGVVDHHQPRRRRIETLHRRQTGGEGLGVVVGDDDHRVWVLRAHRVILAQVLRRCESVQSSPDSRGLLESPFVR